MFKISNKNNLLIGMLSFIFACTTNASQVDNDITRMKSNAAHIKSGEKLYNAACSGCHQKDLSGAMGFNLKDGEWIHGDTASDVFNNISNGFANAGMPAFKNIYSEEQRKQITAYVLSKREGWSNLSYKVFQVDTKKTRNLNEVKSLSPVKSGTLKNNIADFSMPESKEFAVVFEGDFYTYADKDTVLQAYGTQPQFIFKVEIDGKEVKAQGDWSRYWPLKRGKQKLKFTMVTPKKPWPKWANTDIQLIVTNPEKTIKFFPVSSRAKRSLSGTKIELKAENTAIVQRKKVVDLPPYTISVGLPEKMNYGFNTRSCSITGVWKGDLLNIGPNVKGRGQDGSVVLGDWSFKHPEQLAFNKALNCKFIKYTRDGSPTFYFAVDGVTYSVSGYSTKPNTLTFQYTVIENSSNKNVARVSLPNSSTSTILSNDGSIKNSVLTINTKQKSQFSIQVIVKGDE